MKQSDIAYAKIRKMIVLTEMKPGDEIVVSKLEQSLGLGKTPIREALIRLTYEGYVRTIPRKGMLVTALNIDDIGKLRELRLYFTKFLSDAIIRNAGEEEIRRIRAIQDRLRGKQDSFMNAIEADIEFHETTYELSNNRYAEAMLKTNLYLSIRLMVIQKKLGVTIQSTIEDYDRLIECIQNKDAERLNSLFIEHIMESRPNGTV